MRLGGPQTRSRCTGKDNVSPERHSPSLQAVTVLGDLPRFIFPNSRRTTMFLWEQISQILQEITYPRLISRKEDVELYLHSPRTPTFGGIQTQEQVLYPVQLVESQSASVLKTGDSALRSNHTGPQFRPNSPETITRHQSQ